jgi:hypothetical protein
MQAAAVLLLAKEQAPLFECILQLLPDAGAGQSCARNAAKLTDNRQLLWVPGACASQPHA